MPKENPRNAVAREWAKARGLAVGEKPKQYIYTTAEAFAQLPELLSFYLRTEVDEGSNPPRLRLLTPSKHRNVRVTLDRLAVMLVHHGLVRDPSWVPPPDE